MRLVGAPTSFVVAPIVISGAIIGLCGSLIALGLSRLSQILLLERARGTTLAGVTDILLGRVVPTSEALLLVAAGTVLAAIVAGLAAGRAALR